MVGINKTGQDKINFILNNSHLTSNEIAKILNMSPSTVRSIWRQYDINKNNKFIYSLQEFIYIFYMDDESNHLLINYYNRDRHTITNHINKIGLPNKKSMKNKKIKIKEEVYQNHIKEKENYYKNIKYDFFRHIDSKEKAYYLGLLASDGCVYRGNNKRYLINISLRKEDSYILDNFYKILNIKRKCVHINNYCQFQISSKTMFDDLSKYGIVPRKTWIMNIKNIPSEYIPSFLLGYFDGDGSITSSKKNTIAGVGVGICGTKSSMMSIANLLDKLGLSYSLILDNREEKYKGEFYNINFKNTSEKYCFLKLIYSENTDILKLKRKKERVESLINKIENNITNRSENIKAIKEYAVLRQNLEKSQDNEDGIKLGNPNVKSREIRTEGDF